MNIQDLVTAVKRATDARAIARQLFEEDYCVAFNYDGPVKAKERPRSGKGGRMFTPPATREFEAAVRKWAKALNPVCVGFPIKVTLVVYEETAVRETVLHSLWGLTYHDKGDIDNLAKSILDGMNGVMYKDDKQIVSLKLTRRYASAPGFAVDIARAGLTKLEYSNFLKRFNR